MIWLTRKMLKFLFGVTVMISVLNRITANSQTLLIQNECFKDDYTLYTVNEDSNYLLKWNQGTLISSEYCEVRFHAKGKQVLDDYKVCFQVLDFSLNDCEVKIQYHDTTSSSFDTTYNCQTLPAKWCSGENDYAKIIITGAHSAEKSSFTIRISGEKTYDYYDIVGGVAGGVTSGIILIAIVLTVVIYIYKKRSTTRMKNKQPLEPTRLDSISEPNSSNKGHANFGYNDTEEKGKRSHSMNEQDLKPFELKQTSDKKHQNTKSANMSPQKQSRDIADKSISNKQEQVNFTNVNEIRSDFARIKRGHRPKQINMTDDNPKQNFEGRKEEGFSVTNQHKSSSFTKESHDRQIRKSYSKKMDQFEVERHQDYGTSI